MTLGDKPIRAMIYTDLTKEGEVLYNDTYKGYDFYVISYGSHPCCYILLDKKNPFYYQHYDDIPLDVHGGLTYSSKEHYLIDNKGKWIIGWDYAHYGDKFGNRTWSCGDHTWKTKELIKECINAIDRLEEII